MPVDGLKKHTRPHRFFRKILQDATLLVLLMSLLILLSPSTPSNAIVPVSIAGSHPLWLTDLSMLKPSIDLKIDDQIETVGLSTKNMLKRIKVSKTDNRVEPLHFILKKDTLQAQKIAQKYSKQGKEDELYEYFQRTLRTAKSIRPGSVEKYVNINKAAFNLIDREKFSQRFKKPHHKLTVDPTNLAENRSLRKEFIRQLKPYIAKRNLKKLKSKIKYRVPIKLDTELLPRFAKKLVKKFTIFRGPNCFHAALAFQDKKFTNSSRYNVKNEKNYHRSMINYDELWRTLNRSFYEVDPKKSSLKYGDIVVFFEVPEVSPATVSFRWIRHTATYLFDGYTFSKGSKSSNTPYTVKSLSEEWRTWKGYTKLMAVKIFRKSGKNVTKIPPKDLNGWMY